jgi:hypothetical protein
MFELSLVESSHCAAEFRVAGDRAVCQPRHRLHQGWSCSLRIGASGDPLQPIVPPV